MGNPLPALLPRRWGIILIYDSFEGTLKNSIGDMAQDFLLLKRKENDSESVDSVSFPDAFQRQERQARS